MAVKSDAPRFGTQHIIGTNLLTKFHVDRKINTASRVLTRKNALPAGSHVFQPTGIIFKLFQDFIGMNLLTKFHEDRTVNVVSRVLTRFYYIHIRKNVPPLGSMFFKQTYYETIIYLIIFELIQDIFETNLLTKFHEDWTINAASRVLTMKNAPPLGAHVFKATKTIFELIQDIIGTKILTKNKMFGANQPTNQPTDQQTNQQTNRQGKNNMSPTTIVGDIKMPRPHGGHVFQPTGIIF
ncbi:hypothetical protein DPMN_074972 [Dreissena polymorpha]|uniref:Uncharacterized protein n=1 Tax=Dreissena polymorpha TaxID=45954 RepID=A0A9D4BL54_DREPO|nr:hypothetical protein DPMN_074972 [Dreissena polymorpha]